MRRWSSKAKLTSDRPSAQDLTAPLVPKLGSRAPLRSVRTNRASRRGDSGEASKSPPLEQEPAGGVRAKDRAMVQGAHNPIADRTTRVV